MSEVKREKLDFNHPVGGERLTQDAKRGFDRIDYMLKNMEFNKAYIYKKSKNFTEKLQLRCRWNRGKIFKRRFSCYCFQFNDSF